MTHYKILFRSNIALTVNTLYATDVVPMPLYIPLEGIKYKFLKHDLK
jgi:hypothetical protein